MSKKIPGPKGRFLIGNLGQIDISKLHVILSDLKKEHGNIFEFWIFSQRIIVISDVSLLERAFCKRELSHRPEEDFIKQIKCNGSGYIDSNFSEKELALKSVVYKAFSIIKTDSVLTKLHDAELEAFLTSLDQPEDVPIRQLLMKSVAKQYAIDLTGVAGTDKHSTAATEWLDSLINIYDGGKAFVLAKLPWLRYILNSFKSPVDRLMRARDQLTETIVADARTHLQKSEPHGVLQYMMAFDKQEDGKDHAITEGNLIACSMDMVFNSIIPVGHNLSFVVLQAITYPEMQQKIHAELNSIEKGVNVTETSRESTPYLEAFILECMRYLTLVHVTPPHVTSEDTEVDGYLFTKGAIVIPNLFGMNHDEQIWDQPWSFKPERFMDKHGKLLSRSDPIRKQLVTFGSGIRKCEGMASAMDHMYRYALGMFASYKIVPVEDSSVPPNDPREFKIEIALSVPDFKCRFEKK